MKSRKSTKPKSTGRTVNTPAKSGQKDNVQAIAAVDAGDGHIDKIRDIIFGRQMEDYEERFNRLEHRITSQIDALRKEIDDKLMAMNTLVEKYNDTLSERLKDETSSRGQESKTLSKAIDELSARQVQDVQSLIDQLAALSNDLSDALHIQQVEASKNLEQAVQELDDAKLARAALSRMLVDVAGQLSDPKK
jgi:DNA repair exonuclease SbcCD ATPase subunit